MASTYTPIATQTLGSAASSVTFSSIAGTYTDLILVLNLKGTASNYPTLTLNSDTGSNYSDTALWGDGTTAGSGRNPNSTVMYITEGASTDTSEFKFNSIVQFMNYSNSSTYKTVLVRTNGTTSRVETIVGLWRSTSAINTIKINANTSTFATGSTFTLYGIKAA